MPDVLSRLIILYETVKISYTLCPCSGTLAKQVRPSELVAFPNANIFHECVWGTGMAESMNYFQMLNDSNIKLIHAVYVNGQLQCTRAGSLLRLLIMTGPDVSPGAPLGL